MKFTRLSCLLLALMMLFSACGTNDAPTQSSTASFSEEASLPSPSERSYHDVSVPDVIPNRNGPASDVPSVPHGDFVWKVEGGPGTAHLMGTMHVLKPGYALTPGVVELLEAADALAVEANLLDLNAYVGMVDYMYYPDYSSIRDHLSERGVAHLEAMCEAYGVDFASLEMFHAFSLASSFLGYVLEGSDFSINGVDMHLLLHANENGIPIRELEDYNVYYSAFHTLDDDTLERMCVLTIKNPKDMMKELEDMYELFLSGNDEETLAYLDSEELGEDGLYIAGDGLPLEFEEKDLLYNQYMLDDRNRVMADSIISYIEAGDNVFAAAGLAHFLGDNSIIDLLTQGGYTVTRVTF